MQGARSLARIFATGNVMLFVNRPGRWDATRIEQGGIALIYNHINPQFAKFNRDHTI